MKKRPERIDGLVKDLIKKLDERSIPTSDAVIKAWGEIVGRKARVHTKPTSLRKKKLVINVDGSTWLYELTLKKDDLIRALKKRLGEDKIQEIQFRIGEL